MLIAGVFSFVINSLNTLPSVVIYLVLFLLVFGEAALFIGFVLPAETSVLVAGALASTGGHHGHGHPNIVVLCAVVVVAAITGDSVGYLVGERYGRRLIALPLVKKRRPAIDRALEGLQRRGATYVFIGRFTAFLRAVMPGLAGMSKMRYGRFLAANAAGGVVWGLGFTLMGYFAGKALVRVEKTATWVGLGVLVVVIAAVVVLHFRGKRKEKLESDRWQKEHPEELASGEEPRLA